MPAEAFESTDGFRVKRDCVVIGVALATCLAVSGCGGNSSSPAHPTGSAAPGSTGTGHFSNPAASNGQSGIADPCKLLTSSDVEELLGSTPTANSPTRPDQESCQWVNEKELTAHTIIEIDSGQPEGGLQRIRSSNPCDNKDNRNGIWANGPISDPEHNGATIVGAICYKEGRRYFVGLLANSTRINGQWTIRSDQVDLLTRVASRVFARV